MGRGYEELILHGSGECRIRAELSVLLCILVVLRCVLADHVEVLQAAHSPGIIARRV